MDELNVAIPEPLGEGGPFSFDDVEEDLRILGRKIDEIIAYLHSTKN